VGKNPILVDTCSILTVYKGVIGGELAVTVTIQARTAHAATSEGAVLFMLITSFQCYVIFHKVFKNLLFFFIEKKFSFSIMGVALQPLVITWYSVLE
jgi:hypothetical protein